MKELKYNALRSCATNIKSRSYAALLIKKMSQTCGGA